MDRTYSDEERQAVIDRAYALLDQDAAERPERERDMAEREARRLAGDEPQIWRLPESEPSPRAAVPRRNERRRVLPAWVTLQIRNEVGAAVRRELRSEEKGGLADGLGKVLAGERAEFRRNLDAVIARIAALEAEHRAAPDDNAAVLDLSAERRRRAGE